MSAFRQTKAAATTAPTPRAVRSWCGGRCVGFDRRCRRRGLGGRRGRRHRTAVAGTEALAVRRASLPTFASAWADARARLAGRAHLARRGRRLGSAVLVASDACQRGVGFIRAHEVQAAGVVLAFERRRVTQPRVTRALDNALALEVTVVLDAPDALVHRQLADERPRTVF